MIKIKSTEQEGGMGFKDKQKALDTLKILDGRDISYQYHVIMSFVSRVKRTLQITRDEEKLMNLRDALKIFEDWLIDYKKNNRAKENLAYLPIETIKAFRSLAKKYNVWNDEFFSTRLKPATRFGSRTLVPRFFTNLLGTYPGQMCECEHQKMRYQTSEDRKLRAQI